MKPIAIRFLFIYFVGLFAGCTNQDEVTLKQGVVMVPIGAQSVTAAYGQLRNSSEAPVTLVGATAPWASHVEIHRNFYEDGMMKMREVETIAVAAGESFIFEPGAYHFMIMGVSDDIRPGKFYPFVLVLENGQNIEVSIEAKSH